MEIPTGMHDTKKTLQIYRFMCVPPDLNVSHTTYIPTHTQHREVLYPFLVEHHLDEIIEDAVPCNLLYNSTGNKKILEIRK